MNHPTYLNIRPTPKDLQHLETIAKAMQVASGRTFVNRTDAVRHALGTTAGAIQNHTIVSTNNPGAHHNVD